MTRSQRVMIATLLLFIDLIAFVVPVGSCFIFYVLVFRPPWAKQLMDQVYSGS